MNSVNSLEREAWQVVERLEAAGHEAYLVGGCVRDKLLGRDIYDYDITTSAMPEQVMELFPAHRPTGLKHGTVTVLMELGQYEVTTFRTDGEYEDGRHPEQVIFVRSLTEDLARRDFTINAMALGRDGRLHDPFGGKRDLGDKVICAVGDPLRRFAEDALRMLRGIRFAAQLRFAVEERTLQGIAFEAHALKSISRERIRDEWQKMLLAAPDIAIPLLLQTDAMRQVLTRAPQFDLQVNDPWGTGEDPWALAARLAANAPRDFALRFAVVLVAIRVDEARREKMVQDLKLPNQAKRDVLRMCEFYNKHKAPRLWSDVEWRSLLYEHGEEVVRGACLLHALFATESVEEWQAEVACRCARQPIWSVRDLALTSHELIEAGVPVGPLVGRAQSRLAQWVLQEPSRNEMAALRQQVQEWLDKGNL